MREPGILLAFALSARSSPSENATSGTENPSSVPCRTGPGTTVLYEGSVTGLASDGHQIVVQGDAIRRVPLSGGDAVTVATPGSPSGIVVFHGVAYFFADEPMGAPSVQGTASSGSVLQAVPVEGGTPTVVARLAVSGVASPAVDDDSLYFTGLSFGTVVKVTPPSMATLVLALDGPIGINAIAPHGDYVYVGGIDGTSGPGLVNGVIERIPKNGGKAERLLSGIGHPEQLVADDAGLFWIGDGTQMYGPDAGPRLVRSNLDGSSAQRFLPNSATSLAIANGRLIVASESIEAVPTSGGTPSTITSSAGRPGMLQVVGGNVVWVDPARKALSDPTAQKVETACLPSATD